MNTTLDNAAVIEEDAALCNLSLIGLARALIVDAFKAMVRK